MLPLHSTARYSLKVLPQVAKKIILICNFIGRSRMSLMDKFCSNHMPLKIE